MGFTGFLITQDSNAITKYKVLHEIARDVIESQEIKSM